MNIKDEFKHRSMFVDVARKLKIDYKILAELIKTENFPRHENNDGIISLHDKPIINGTVQYTPTGKPFLENDSFICGSFVLPDEQITAYKLAEGVVLNKVIESKPYETVGIVVNGKIQPIEKSLPISVETTLPDDTYLQITLSRNNRRIDITEGDIIGSRADIGIESKVALTKYKIAIHNEKSYTTPKTKLPRLDLPFIAIDGSNTKDVDDAIYFNKTGTNTAVLYVAIADVSEYVKKDSVLDMAALKQGSTAYMPHNVFHMLPRELSEEHCSLNDSVARNALICKINLIDKDGIWQSLPSIDSEWLNAEIVCKRHSYDYVDENLHMFEDLLDFSKRNSFKQSSVFRSNEYKFKLENGKIKELSLYNSDTPSHKIVESAMLQANKEAAVYLSDFGFFRSQLKPSLPAEFCEFSPQEQEKTLKKTLKSAFYGENEGHYSLNTTHYTHFTSPIRRYCDIVVHRLIKAKMQNLPAPYTRDELDVIAAQINLTGKRHKGAEFLADNLLLCEYAIQLEGTQEPVIAVEELEHGTVFRGVNSKLESFVPQTRIPEAHEEWIIDGAILSKGKIRGTFQGI